MACPPARYAGSCVTIFDSATITSSPAANANHASRQPAVLCTNHSIPTPRQSCSVFWRYNGRLHVSAVLEWHHSNVMLLRMVTHLHLCTISTLSKLSQLILSSASPFLHYTWGAIGPRLHLCRDKAPSCMTFAVPATGTDAIPAILDLIRRRIRGPASPSAND